MLLSHKRHAIVLASQLCHLVDIRRKFLRVLITVIRQYHVQDVRAVECDVVAQFAFYQEMIHEGDRTQGALGIQSN